MMHSIWYRFNRHAFALPSLAILCCFIIAAIVGDWIMPYSATETLEGKTLLPPLWMDGGLAAHPFGTDDLGRDVLARLLAGARYTMGLMFITVSLAFIAGVAIGILSAAVGGALDVILMRIADVLLAVPSLLFAIVLVAGLGHGLSNTIAAVSLTLLPHFIRTTRRSLRDEMAREYIAAARLDGASGFTLFWQSLLPNIATPLVLQTTLACSTAILDITAIGFLGLGVQAPTPEWGGLLFASHDFIQIAPWLVMLPGAAIFIAVLSVNLCGDALRDALDPNSRFGRHS